MPITDNYCINVLDRKINFILTNKIINQKTIVEIK